MATLDERLDALRSKLTPFEVPTEERDQAITAGEVGKYPGDEALQPQFEQAGRKEFDALRSDRLRLTDQVKRARAEEQRLHPYPKLERGFQAIGLGEHVPDFIAPSTPQPDALTPHGAIQAPRPAIAPAVKPVTPVKPVESAPSRFKVEEGEIIDTRGGQIISTDQFNRLSNDQEKDEIERQLRESGLLADDQAADQKPQVPVAPVTDVLEVPPVTVTPETAASEAPSPKNIGEGFKEAIYNYFQGVAGIPAGALKSIAIASKSLDDILPEALKDDREIESRLTYRLGSSLDQLAKKLFPADPAMQKNFIVGVLPQALGSMTGFLAGGLAGMAAKAPITATAVLGAQVGGTEQYEDAKEFTADETTRKQAFWLGSAVGSTEALPIAGILNRFNKATGGRFVQVLKESGITAAQEFLQEWGQQVGSNAIAQQLYDEHRSLFENAGISGAAGGTTGGIVGFISGLLQGRKARRQQQNERTPQASPLFTEPAAPPDLSGIPGELQITSPDQRPPFLMKQPAPMAPPVTVPTTPELAAPSIQEPGGRPLESAVPDEAAMTPDAVVPGAVPSREQRDKIIDLSGMGEAISDNLYETLFEKVRQGKTKEAGQESVYLQAAKPVYEAGGIKDAQDMRAFVEALQSAVNLKGNERNSAIREVIKEWTPESAIGIPSTDESTQEKDDRPLAPAVFQGVQQGVPGLVEDFELYNLTEDIPGHPAGSTVARETIEKAGYRLPERTEQAAQPNQDEIIDVPPVTVTPETAAKELVIPSTREVRGPSLQEIHAAAEAKNIPWDNDPAFMELTEQATGKRHLDTLTGPERLRVMQAIEALPAAPKAQTSETATRPDTKKAPQRTVQSKVQAYIESLPRNEAQRAYARALADGMRSGTLPATPKNLTGAEVQAIQKGLIEAVATRAVTPALGTPDQAAHEAATSPENALPEPSQAQKDAGNYRKGHVRVAGLDISIENPEGSTRSGTDANGKPWSVTMQSHYGYIKGTVGKDKDHLDVFIKPGTPEDFNGTAYVVDQVDPKSGTFDEHKIVLGSSSIEEARRLYQENYAKDWKGLGSISATPMNELKEWMKSGETKKPFARNVVVPTPELASASSIITEPRSSLTPEQSAEMLLRAEKAQADLEIAGKETGRRKVFDYGTPGQGGTPDVTRLQSAAPDWYRELTTGPRPLKRAQIEAAIQKIIRDQGVDVGVAVERVKKALLGDREFNSSPWGDDAESIMRGEWPSWIDKPSQAPAQSVSPTPEQAARVRPEPSVQENPMVPTVSRETTKKPKRIKETKKTAPRLEGKPGQQEIPVPPPTIGERPIIGREATPEEAPLFSKAAQTPEPEQQTLPDTGKEREAKQEPEKPETPTKTPVALASEAASPTDIIASALRQAADQIEGKTIQDVGEKIGGARKDRWATRGLTLDDLDEMSGGEESKYVTKANIWKPDYASMVKDGTDPKAAALVKIVYDRLAAKPAKDTPEGRRQYVEMMGYVKEAYGSIKTLDDVKRARQELLKYATADTGRLSPIYASVFKDRSEPFYLDFSAQRRASKMVAEGFPDQEPWTRRYSITNYGGPNLTKEGVEYYEKKGGPWAVVEKSSKRILAYKPDEASATAEAQRLYAQKSTDKDKGREPERPHLDDLKRSGADYRNGQHVTAEDFRVQFGFRGVEFGNYAASDERQKHVDQAYDALMDLSTLLGIPPKAISLNGTLGLAFGARGSGKAKAHYEPSKLVINITKVNGPGALAHEWGHALDHYFGELDRPDAYAGSPKGASGWMQLGKYTGAPERRYTKHGVEEVQRLPNLRPEMRQAFDRVMDALFHRSKTKAEEVRDAELKLEETQGLISKYEQDIAKTKEKAVTPPDKLTVSWLKQAEDYLKTLKIRQDIAGKKLTELTGGSKPEGGYGRVETSFYKQAQMLSGPTGDYWKRPTEMFARAFESYVFDRLGTESQYLVHSVEADRYTKEKGYKGNPYPEGPERDTIRSAFDGLFDTMQSKETDTGTALYENEAAHEAELKDQYGLTSDKASDDNKPYALRPGEQQRLNYDIARQALGDLDRAGDAVSSTTGVLGVGVPARTLGLSFSPEFIHDGVIDLTGRPVRSAQDLAKLAQVYRNPRFETFRIFYVKDGTIVGHEGLTSRLPGLVKIFKNTEDAKAKIAMIQERMDELDATSYYMLHNHPSGNSNPSKEDFAITERFAMNIPGFKGHVVIDSNEYTVLDFNEDDNIEGKKSFMPELGQDKLLTPSIPNPLLSAPITSSSDIVAIAQKIKVPEDYAVVIYRGSSNAGTRAIQEVSIEFLSDPKKAGPYLQEQARAFGVVDVATHYQVSGDWTNAKVKALQRSMDQLIENGTVIDHVVSGVPGSTPVSRADQGVVKRPEMFLGQKFGDIASESVAEDEPYYGNRKYKDEAQAYLRARATEENTPGQTGTIEPHVTRGRLSSAAVSVRPLLLGSLGLHQLSMVYGKDHQEVADYNKASQQMEADFLSMTRDSDVILKQWDKLDRNSSDQTSRLMEDARLANYDPDPEPSSHHRPEFPVLPKEMALRESFNRLPDDAKAVYRTVRNFYSDMADARFEAIRNRIQRSGGTPENRKALLDRLEVAYEKVRAKVYFPFTRFGEHLVIARKLRDGKEVDRAVSAFESPREAARVAASMQKDGWTVKQTIAKEYSQDKQGGVSKVVREILDVVDGIKTDPDIDGTASSKQQLKEAINQAFLQALPDLSYAKHFIHAKDVKGFSKDAIRAFAHSALHGAHHISRINNADFLSKALLDLDERINETHEGDTTEARQVFNELVKRHNEILNPNTSPVAAWLGKLGFTMSLAGSVATGITNATQVPLVTYPWLGARYGIGRASVALTKAYKDFLDPRTLNADSLFDASKSKRISEDDRAALVELQRRGRIDLTQTMDLSGRAAQDNLSRVAKQHGSLQDKIAKVLGFTFHAPEVMNRQVTALATYRMAREAGRDHDDAIDAAEQAIIETHFIYTAENRPRFMSGNVLRVLTMFKQYSQNIAFLYGRAAQIALTKTQATPAEKRVALKQLTMMLGLQYAAAGALGLPFVGTVASLFTAMLNGFRDDDDEIDWEVELRKQLADLLGEKGGEVASHGLSRVTPWDMAGRLGQSDLFFRAPKREREGRAAFMDWVTSFSGPVLGYATNAYLGVGDVVKGIKDVDAGHFLRGVEELTPAFLRSVVKSLRYQIEGGVRTRDDYKQLDVNSAEKLGQFFGFTPSRVSEMYESVTAIKNLEHKLTGRRKELLDQYASAYQQTDMDAMRKTAEEVKAFNQKHPELRITDKTLKRSYSGRLQHAQQTKDGLYLPKTREFLRSQGNFGEVDDDVNPVPSETERKRDKKRQMREFSKELKRYGLTSKQTQPDYGTPETAAP